MNLMHYYNSSQLVQQVFAYRNEVDLLRAEVGRLRRDLVRAEKDLLDASDYLQSLENSGFDSGSSYEHASNQLQDLVNNYRENRDTWSEEQCKLFDELTG